MGALRDKRTPRTRKASEARLVRHAKDRLRVAGTARTVPAAGNAAAARSPAPPKPRIGRTAPGKVATTVGSEACFEPLPQGPRPSAAAELPPLPERGAFVGAPAQGHSATGSTLLRPQAGARRRYSPSGRVSHRVRARVDQARRKHFDELLKTAHVAAASGLRGHDQPLRGKQVIEGAPPSPRHGGHGALSAQRQVPPTPRWTVGNNKQAANPGSAGAGRRGAGACSPDWRAPPLPACVSGRDADRVFAP